MSTSRQGLLITGGSGLLALNWARAVEPTWKPVLGLHRRTVAPSFAVNEVVDLLSPDDVAAALDRIEPKLVVHAAGMTSVEQCESDPHGARLANVRIPAIVAEQCRRRGVKLVGISTDHLFVSTSPFVHEDDVRRPLNMYGRTKSDGEVAILDACPSALIVRTNFFCWGPSYRQSFSDWIISGLRRGKRLRLFADVFFTPIFVDELVRAVHELVSLDESGIYHVVADTRLSKHDFGCKIADIFGLSPLFDPIRLKDQPNLAPRPLEMSLSNGKLTTRLRRPIGDIDHHLRLLANQESQPDIREIQSL